MADKAKKDQTPEQIAETAKAEAAKLAAFMNLLGTPAYSVESGAVTLYADKRRAGVKNGRAGHVSFALGAWNIPCSVYMDVETVQDNGRDAIAKTYRLSFPKGVKAVFADAAEEKKFKNAQIKAWLAARTSKQTISDASGDESAIREIEPLEATA